MIWKASFDGPRSNPLRGEGPSNFSYARIERKEYSMPGKIVVVVGAIIAAMALWRESFPIPNWALVAFVVFLFVMGIVISVKRVRAERDLARTFWKALSRR